MKGIPQGHFDCERLRCKGLSYTACIRRQLAKARKFDAPEKACKRAKYSECLDCEQGRRIINDNPELVEVVRKQLRVPKDPIVRKPIRKKADYPTYFHKEPDVSLDVKAIKAIDRGLLNKGNGKGDNEMGRKKGERRGRKKTEELQSKTTGRGDVLSVDFTPYPSLFDRLLHAATKDFRTPEGHILKMLHEQFGEE